MFFSNQDGLKICVSQKLAFAELYQEAGWPIFISKASVSPIIVQAKCHSNPIFENNVC